MPISSFKYQKSKSTNANPLIIPQNDSNYLRNHNKSVATVKNQARLDIRRFEEPAPFWVRVPISSINYQNSKSGNAKPLIIPQNDSNYMKNHNTRVATVKNQSRFDIRSFEKSAAFWQRLPASSQNPNKQTILSCLLRIQSLVHFWLEIATNNSQSASSHQDTTNKRFETPAPFSANDKPSSTYHEFPPNQLKWLIIPPNAWI